MLTPRPGQAVVNAAPTAGEGARVRRCVSALVSAGLAGGYLLSPRLREVHWQAAGRPVPVPETGIAGESALFVDPAEVPAREDVARLGRALAVLAGDYGLMACFAAYTGLRWGELAALTITQVDPGTRTVTVDRKVIEVGGRQYAEVPKGRTMRRTVHPRQAPAGHLGQPDARGQEHRDDRGVTALGERPARARLVDPGQLIGGEDRDQLLGGRRRPPPGHRGRDTVFRGQPSEELLQGTVLVAGIGVAVPAQQPHHPLLDVVPVRLLPPGLIPEAGGGEPLHRLGIGSYRLG